MFSIMIKKTTTKGYTRLCWKYKVSLSPLSTSSNSQRNKYAMDYPDHHFENQWAPKSSVLF